MKKTNGFPNPNYTQTPNDFFELLADMEDSELRVTLVMIRNTFGYHKNGFKMGVKKLANAAGLSENGAKTGARAAEERGTFRRVNPDSLKEAEWELVVEGSITDGSVVDGSANDPLGGQPVTPNGSAIDPQSPLQIKIKERKKGDAPLPSGMDWKLGHGEPITEEDQKAEDHKKMVDAANNIAINVRNGQLAFALALAFMEALGKPILGDAKQKRQASALEEMITDGVTPAMVKRAVAIHKEKRLNLADLHSILRTVGGLVNEDPAPEPVKPKIVRAPAQTGRQPLPDFVLKKQAEIRKQLERMAGSDPTTA